MIIVTRFLERKWVIQLFGLALIIAPFANTFIQFLVVNSKAGMSLRYVNISKYFLSGSVTNYALALGSLIIGAVMLSGSKKAWKAVLVLVGTHIAIQIYNYQAKQWQGMLGWSAFIVNVSVFFFIADQLVWRIKSKEELIAEAAEKKSSEAVIEQNLSESIPVSVSVSSTKPVVEEKKPVEKILHLQSYRKIFFSFDSDRPWGRLMTLTSHQLIVNCFEKAPESIENKVVQIRFNKNLVVDIKFDRKESNLYYFTPLDMTPDRVTELNQWLKKIAV